MSLSPENPMTALEIALDGLDQIARGNWNRGASERMAARDFARRARSEALAARSDTCLGVGKQEDSSAGSDPSPASRSQVQHSAGSEEWWLLHRLFTVAQAAQTYFDGYCQDEAADDGMDYTGCSWEQHWDAKALKNALADYSAEEALRAVNAAARPAKNSDNSPSEASASAPATDEPPSTLPVPSEAPGGGGWVLVPREPTLEMLDAACDVGPDTNTGCFSYDDASVIWQAMIAAAPPADEPLSGAQYYSAVWERVRSHPEMPMFAHEFAWGDEWGQHGDFRRLMVAIFDAARDALSGAGEEGLREALTELLAASKAVVAIADRKTDAFDRAHAAIATAEKIL